MLHSSFCWSKTSIDIMSMPVPGETDKLSLEEAGFTNVVSVPNGAPDKVKNGPLPEHSADKAFEYVWNCWEELQQASCILLGTDNDLPGHALAEELARRLGTCCMLLETVRFQACHEPHFQKMQMPLS